MADPIWLPEVLRAEGLICHIYPGAMDRGHGDFGAIWGVVAHHTGDEPPYDSGPEGIANHPTLGLCSQLYLSRKGEFTLVGIGIAWHAGNGSWPGIARDAANNNTIGIEADNSGSEGWTPKQYDAYVRGVAAILRKLGHNSQRVIAHREWYHGRAISAADAQRAGGKWDPGGIDMAAFRRDVQNAIDRKPSTPPKGASSVWTETFQNFKGNVVNYGFAVHWIDKLVNLINDQLVGPDGRGWKILGKSKVDPARDNTAVEALAEVRQDVKNLLELAQRGPQK